MFKPPSEGITNIARAGIKNISGKTPEEINTESAAASKGAPPAPGAYSLSSKPKRRGSAPTFLGASALPPSGSIQSGGGKTLLGQ